MALYVGGRDVGVNGLANGATLVANTLRKVNRKVTEAFTHRNTGLVLLSVSPRVRGLTSRLYNHNRHYATIITSIHSPTSMTTTVGHTGRGRKHVSVLIGGTNIYHLNDFLSVDSSSHSFRVSVGVGNM